MRAGWRDRIEGARSPGLFLVHNHASPLLSNMKNVPKLTHEQGTIVIDGLPLGGLCQPAVNELEVFSSDDCS